jgi:ribosomal-protein-alanine N-acetyltransferase
VFKWPSRIETERLFLFPIERKVMVRINRGERPDISIYQPHPQWPLPILLEAFPVMANDLLDDPSLIGWHAWCIVHMQDKMIIGDVGFKGAPDEKGLIKVGYSVIPAYRNKGIAREAVEAIVNIVKEDPEVKRITAEVLALNLPSIRMLRSLGWEHVSDNEEMEIWEYPMGE